MLSDVMLIEIVLLIFLSFVPACFSYFLDYCLGFPSSDDKLGTSAIFFWYTFRLARRRLTPKQHNDIVMGLKGMLDHDDPATRHEGKRLLKIAVVMEGRKYFKWELAFGMCPFCTGFWIALISAFIMLWHIDLIAIFPPFIFILIPIFAHTILRKLLK